MQANSESGLRIVSLGVIQQLRGQDKGAAGGQKKFHACPPRVGGCWSTVVEKSRGYVKFSRLSTRVKSLSKLVHVVVE